MVEIGASNVLAVMAQRTLASKYEAHDAVHSIQRKVLTWAKDAREICYEVEAAEEPTQEIATPAVDVQDDIPTAQPIQQQQQQQQQSSRPEKAAAIQDVPLSPTDVLRAIIAQKLKKSLADVAPRLSIKDLAGGKPPS